VPRAATRPPGLREVWRPFYPAAVIAGAATGWAVLAFARRADGALAAAVFLVIIAVLQAAVRSLLWRLRPGSVTVSCDETAIYFRRGTRVVRSCPCSAVRRLDVVAAGPRSPEWTTWAAFTEITCVTGSWAHFSSVSSPEILLAAGGQDSR